jgi:hypothetical protein
MVARQLERLSQTLFEVGPRFRLFSINPSLDDHYNGIHGVVIAAENRHLVSGLQHLGSHFYPLAPV